VQAYLDFGNGMGMGNGYPENWITAVGGHIAAVHAKDYDRVLKAHVCCGEGDLPWAEAFSALRDVGFDDYLMIETPPKAGRGKPTRAEGLHAARTSLSWLAQFV
jgi:hexulose-6-phosphate isomerase